MSEKLYAGRDQRELEPHFCAHMMALTAEDLRSKSDIASELAYRDREIERLRTQQERDAVLIAAKNEQVAELRAEFGMVTLYKDQIAARLESCEQALANEFNEAEQLRAEVERLKAEVVPEGWKPIHSAPQDGTHILARRRHDVQPCVVHWFAEESEWFHSATDVENPPVVGLTEWRHLPSAMLAAAPQPPTAQAAECINPFDYSRDLPNRNAQPPTAEPKK